MQKLQDYRGMPQPFSNLCFCAFVTFICKFGTPISLLFTESSKQAKLFQLKEAHQQKIFNFSPCIGDLYKHAKQVELQMLNQFSFISPSSPITHPFSNVINPDGFLLYYSQRVLIVLLPFALQYSRHFVYSNPAQPLGPEDLVWRMVCIFLL